MKLKRASYQYSVPWNIFLITLGAMICAIGLKAIVVPQGFITGGIAGVGLLGYYYLKILSPGVWYFLINIPIFILGWLFVSRRFFLYSVFGMIIFSLGMDLVSFQIPVKEPLLAVLAAGTIIGAGSGIVLHSLGSCGGNDIIGVVLNQKFNIRIGTYGFVFNMLLFACSFGVLSLDAILFSLALSFVTAQVLDYFLGIFNQRKMVLAISEQYDLISHKIQDQLHRGVTFLEGTGAYTGNPRKIIMTVVNNYQLKRLEEIIFTLDPEAFVITENTFNVLGNGFSHRKVY